MTRNQLILLAAGGSLLLLLGAFGFQAAGFAPCKLCLWQRWPHGAAFAIGLLAFWSRNRILPMLGALAATVTAALGIYHTGVEQSWWEGPNTCTSASVSEVSVDDLLNQIMTAPLIRCDEVVWSLLGLSMASWNAILSLALAAIWLAAARSA